MLYVDETWVRVEAAADGAMEDLLFELEEYRLDKLTANLDPILVESLANELPIQ